MPHKGAGKDQSRHARDSARAKPVIRTNTVTLGSPLGPAMDATRRRLQGPKRPGSLARSESRSARARVPRKEKAKASEATLGIPLGIPLGAATQRRHSCGSHTVSTRQTLLRLVWPCQPGLFASRLPTRFSTAIAVLTIEFGFGIHKQRAPIKAWQFHP